MLGDDAAEHRACAAHRDLLADDGAHRRLEAVDRAGRAQPGSLEHQRRERRVARERGVDGDRVGVEVEQPAHPGDHGDEIAGVVQPHRALQGVRRRASTDTSAGPPGARSTRV